ncbi:hypothetical protein DESC_290193 [Desulfosarcina cetonica]|nr:hypothetical protein DESC_290193 [Desulfosarcina cetonica]
MRGCPMKQAFAENALASGCLIFSVGSSRSWLVLIRRGPYNDGSSREGWLFAIPTVDVGIVILAASGTIGAVRDDIKVVMGARTQIDKIIAPRIAGDLAFLQITAFTPVFGNVTGGGRLDQCLQSLLGGGVCAVVQLVEFERRADAFDLHACLYPFGLLGTAHDARNDQAGKDAENDNDHHQFDQGEPAAIVHVAQD